jgi:peptidoglycan/xylan/chitin deacetylase (PgdA/CDA1 family)
MRHYRPCPAVRFIYPRAVFRFATNGKEACLTFDDGPDPLSTPVILDILERHQIRAIFFCSGIQSEIYPDLMDMITARGHVTGNHGYRHLNGFRHFVKTFTDDVFKASAFTSSTIFRPPYGFLSPGQYFRLKKTFRIVLWDLMAYDFDRRFGKEEMLNVLGKKLRTGSIVVLHDKHTSRAVEILEDFIRFAEREGYQFVLPEFVRQGTLQPR